MAAVIVLLTLLAVASGASLCPRLKGKLDFEPEKFAGNWHYAGYNSNPNRPWELNCAEFNVTVTEAEKSGSFKLAYVFNYLSNGKKTLVTMNTETYSVHQPGLFYSAGKRIQSNFWSAVHQGAIIATDYDNYAVAILCAPLYDSSKKTFDASVWGYIWSRSSTLGDETFTVLKNILIDHGIDAADVKDLRNSMSCSEN